MRRNTSQKTKILEYLRSVKTHPTAEKVYNAVKKDLPAVSLATVYRNLNILADEGIITRLEINKELHFDGDISCHQHCVCKSCGKIIDIFNKEVAKCAMKKLTTKEFSPECINIIIYGRCKRCKR